MSSSSLSGGASSSGSSAGSAPRVAYLHGFASSPQSKKGVHLQHALRAHDVVVHLPDLRRPTFATLTHDAMLAALDEMDATQGDPRAPWVLVGSSLGGHLASLWAARNPARVAALLLLCPAFDVAGRWPALRGAEAMARWQRDGTLLHDDDAGVPQPLHWEFLAAAARHDPWPAPVAPAVVVHGRADVVVPLASSERFVAARPDTRRLVVVDDDHDLMSSIDVVERELVALVTGLAERGASR